MLRPMSRDEIAKSIERADMLSSFIHAIDWGAVLQIIVEWDDDSDIIPPSTFGQKESTKKAPTKEVLTIHIVCEPGSLPIPRNEDGSPQGEGAFI